MSATPSTDNPRVPRGALIAIGLLATIQIVCVYIENITPYLHLDRFELGLERMPFQGRLLMELPLRWAHFSPVINYLATRLAHSNPWFHQLVLPEGIIEFTVDLIAVVAAGLVARDMYRFHSKTGLLSAYVYPVFLAMVATSYCLITVQPYRYVYDLPQLGLFACGLYLIYRKRHPLLFAVVFLLATLNRETSIFLLFFFLVSHGLVDGKLMWRRLFHWRTGGVTLILAVFWLAWCIGVTRHFAGHKSEYGPHPLRNFAYLLWPFFWPQLAGVAAYTVPLLLLFKSWTRNTELRLWAIAIPAWAAVMFRYGMLMEIRLFGELLPLFACLIMLVAEERILLSLRAPASESP